MATLTKKQIREAGVTNAVTASTATADGVWLRVTTVGSLDETLTDAELWDFSASDTGAVLDVAADGLRVSSSALGSGLTGGSASTISVDINGLTALSVADPSDELMIYDSSAGALKKITKSDIFDQIVTNLSTSLTTLTAVVESDTGTDATIGLASNLLAGIVPAFSAATDHAAIDPGDKVLGFSSGGVLGLFDAITTANLGITHNAGDVDITSDVGTDITLDAATVSLAGAMSAADKAKLDGVTTGANLYVHPNHSGDIVSVADGSTTIQPDAITTAKILDGQVTTAKIASGTILVGNMAADSVDTSQLVAAAVTAAKIDTDAVTTAKILDSNVTNAKLADSVAYSLKGNATGLTAAPTDIVYTDVSTDTPAAGKFAVGFDASGLLVKYDVSNFTGTTNLGITHNAGDVDITSSSGTDITLDAATVSLAGAMSGADKTKLDGIDTAANLYTHPNHTGDVTSVNDGAQTIAADVVDNTKLADVAAYSLKGNLTGSTADPTDIVRADLTLATDVDYTDRVLGHASDGTVQSYSLYTQVESTAHGLVGGDVGKPLNGFDAVLDDTAGGDFPTGVLVEVVDVDNVRIATEGQVVDIAVALLDGGNLYDVGVSGRYVYWDASDTQYEAAKPGDSATDMPQILEIINVDTSLFKAKVLGFGPEFTAATPITFSQNTIPGDGVASGLYSVQQGAGVRGLYISNGVGAPHLILPYEVDGDWPV